MAEIPKTPGEKFKAALEDAIAVITKLQPFCKDVEQLLGMISHALENDGQLCLLYSIVSGQVKK